MSKIRTNNLQARSNSGTITLGVKNEDGTTNYNHTTKIIGGVDIEGYASKKYVLDHLLNDGLHTEDIVMKAEAGQPGGYARLTSENIPQVDWYDMKNTIRDNHYDYRINKSHNTIDSELTGLKEDVTELQGEISSLITLNEKGSWQVTNAQPPEIGKIHFSSRIFEVNEMTVKISKLDTDGTVHTFNTAEIGTWMELVEDDADYCLGQIKELDNEDDDFFEAKFDVSVAKGEVIDDSNVKVRLFEASEFDPASIRIVDIDDKPPVEPNEGDLWFDNNSSDMTLRVFQQASDAWLAVAPATTIEGRVTAGEATQASIQAAQVEMQKTIDNALIEQAKLSEALNANSMPGLSFIYQSGSSNVKENHFLYWGSGSSSRMRLSAKAENIDWLSDGLNFDYTMEDGPYFTIWFLDVNSTGRPKWKMKAHGRVSRIDWHNNDALVYISSQQTNGLLGADISYNITIGGVM